VETPPAEPPPVEEKVTDDEPKVEDLIRPAQGTASRDHG
jgi:hypothetical protein